MAETSPAPQPQLRLWVLISAVVLVMVLAIALWHLPGLLWGLAPGVDLSGLAVPQETAAPPLEDLPEAYTRKPNVYGTPPAAKERPPIATPMVSPVPTPVVQIPAPTPAPAPAPVQTAATGAPSSAGVTPLPSFLETWQHQERHGQTAQRSETQTRPQDRSQAQPVQTPRVQQETRREKPKWGIKPTNLNLEQGHGNGESKKLTGEQKEELGQKGEAAGLITHARWARPKQVWKTLYMSQKLVARMLDAINSDEPGITRVETILPVFDKAGYDYEIIPKGSVVIIKQEGRPEFGTNTLNIKVIQIEFPGIGGEVIKFHGSAGDDQGNGVRGKTNNHYGKLVLAVGINALLSLGSNALAGTPSGYHYDLGQQTAREVSSSTSRDISAIVNRQLKVPPTITKEAGSIVTIQLEENVTFSREPLVVK